MSDANKTSAEFYAKLISSLDDPIENLRRAIEYAISPAFDEAMDAIEWLRMWYDGERMRVKAIPIEEVMK